MPTILHADIESSSLCDIKQCGGHRYANDPSTKLLCVGLALNDEDVVIWIPERWHAVLPWYTKAEYNKACANLKLMSDPSVLVYAHNSTGFEVPMLDALMLKQTGYHPPAHSQYRCTMAMARRAALPASLEKCAEALQLGQKKDHRGKALINKFCVSQAPFEFKATKKLVKECEKRGITLEQAEVEARAAHKEWITPADDPAAFKEFCEYCRQDVVVEREIGKKLKHFELTGFALETFQVDLEMNCRGFPVNLEAIECARAIVAEAGGTVAEEFVALTGLNPTQGVKFLQWAKERDYPAENLQADTLDAIVEDDDFDDSSDLGRALLLRQRVSFAAVNKLDSMAACAGPHDNRVRGTLNWHGAHPGRWTASLVQPHNFKKPSAKLIRGVDARAAGFDDGDAMLTWLTANAYKDITAGLGTDHLEMVYGSALDVISSTIRHFIQDSRPMLDADYSAIEARVLAWLAGEEWRLEVFRTHGKIYEASASQMFGVPLKDITKSLRQKGKVSELALGYQGGVQALITMGALKMGLKEEELKPLVDAWREANPKLVQFWADLDAGARQAMASRGKDNVRVGKLRFFMAQTAGIPYLFMQLPSGRKIGYPWPKIEPTAMWKTKDGERKRAIAPTEQQLTEAHKEDPKGLWKKDGITYYGCIDKKSQKFGRVSLHPGKMAENGTMGTATDVMCVGMVNCHREGYKLLTTVHDELLSAYEPERGQSLEQFLSLTAAMPPWADGLPVTADGAIVDFYTK